jgi:hypothetical protein
MQNNVIPIFADAQPQLVRVSDHEQYGDATTRFEFRLPPQLARLQGVHPDVRLSVTTLAETDEEYDEDGAVIYAGELGITFCPLRRAGETMTGEFVTKADWPAVSAEALANPAETMLRLLSARHPSML